MQEDIEKNETTGPSVVVRNSHVLKDFKIVRWFQLLLKETIAWRILFASHLTEHLHFAESVWKVVVRLFLGIAIVVSCSCKKCHVPTAVSSSCSWIHVPIVMLPSCRNIHAPTSVSVSCKVTHILSKNYCINIVKLLSNTYTFGKEHGSLFKYIKRRKRRCFCVEIEPVSLQGEPSNKIGSRNRHQIYWWFW